jgi:V8-like Glu-specific endopeptidase
MSRNAARLSGLFLALLGMIAFVGLASAAPGDQGRGDSRRDQVIKYWTAERIKNATPRELVVDETTGRIVPQAPGANRAKPGGGGGGAVGGAAWTKGGAVKTTTGKVLFTLPSGDYVCSGSIVNDGATGDGRSLVLTAGHCVYDDVLDVFATNWTFIPDFEDSSSGNVRDCSTTPYGCWVAAALVTTQAWADSDFNDDYAFAVMDATSAPTSLEGLGTQAIAFNQTHPAYVYAFGYPQASPYDGTDLIYCSGKDVADNFGSTAYGLKCNMTGGSSGGPWFLNFSETTGAGTLTSVNSFKYLGGKQKSYMFGPYFDGYTQATYNAARAAVEDTLVTAP